MATRDRRYLINKPGKYYVDCTCLDCDACRQIAPTVFKRYDPDGVSYVFRQPETLEEANLANEAVEACPCESIGNDGDQGDETYTDCDRMIKPSPESGEPKEQRGMVRKCACRIKKIFGK
ncbi:MAG: ferredoxin [Candidatus Sumerlaeaceae bacterium]